MAEQGKQPGALWMFSHEAAGAHPREVDFDPADAIYRLYKNTRNPFLQRVIAPSTRKLERSEAELARLFRFFEEQDRYQVAPGNTGEPFQRRSLRHPAPPPTTRPRYLEPSRLEGNLTRLPWMVDVFFQAVLARLRNDPGSFGQVVEELMAQFKQDGIRIKIYTAYQSLEDWDDLMTTLEEIAHYPAPETFDLFCSALLAYYDLVYPPEEG